MKQTRIDLSYVNYNVVKPKPFIPRPRRIMESVTSTSRYNSVGVYIMEEGYDFHYVLSGYGEVHYNDKTYTVGPGQGFIWNSSYPALSYNYPKSAKEPWKFISFCFNQDNLLPTVENIINTSPVFDIPQDEYIIKILLKNAASKGDITISCAEGANLVYQLIITLLKYSDINEEKEFHPIVNKAKKIIHSEQGFNVNVSELSAELGISREYLSRIFKEYTGERLKAYMQRVKIEASCRYLISTDKSVEEIANALNYSSPSNFSRDFIKIMEVSPKEYRQMKKNVF